MGEFTHEAAAVDPDRRCVYLTHDRPDGRLWRFTPRRYPDLAEGVLEVARVEDGAVRWVPGPRDGTRFNGGEGAWYDGGWLYFTTKGDNRVWSLDCARDRLGVVYDGGGPPDGVDNVTVSAAGDLYVAEDGGDMQVVVITVEGEVAPVVQVVGHDGSEITGPAFSPDGTRLYFSSQRGPEGGAGGTGGVTYEVTGPFGRGGSAASSSSGSGRGRVGTTSMPSPPEDPSGPSLLPLAAGAVVIGGIAALRRRRNGA
jgi:MYXO-CTERM domain-containing protein